MAADKAKIRVALDISQAKASLKEIATAGKRVGRRINKEYSRWISRPLGFVGLGGGIGLGMAAVRGATQSGFGDVIGESFSVLGAQLEDFFLGDLAAKSRAGLKARNEVIQDWSFIAHRRGEIPPESKVAFDVRSARYLEQELGAKMYRSSTDFQGVTLDQLIDKIMTGLRNIMSEAVDALLERLPGVNWFV